MSDPAGPTTPPSVYREALRGDLPPLLRWLATDPTTEHRDWRAAARVLCWLANAGGVSREATEAALENADDTDGFGEAAGLRARAALLTLDLGDANRWVDWLSRRAAPRAQLWHAVTSGWLRVWNGDGDEVPRLADDIRRRATEWGWPSLAVEAVVLGAAGRMVTDDLHGATVLARRACRMARTEHLWAAHFSASLLLARLRRLRGRPHLAGVIAADCLRLAPALWSGQLRWELLFAGGALVKGAAGGVANDAATAVAERMAAGDFSELEAVRAAIRHSAPQARDADALGAATSLAWASIPPSIAPWLSGEHAEVPGRLAGLVAPSWQPERPPLAVGLPGGPGRRMLGLARPANLRLLALHGTRPSRPESIAAALLLAGPAGVTRAKLFEDAYGFAFRKELHEPSFKVARHQAKKVLADGASLETSGDRVAVSVTGPTAVVDPRCQQPLPDVLLRQIAAAGGASARELASRLNVSLRTIQAALRDMVDDGVCVTERDGRAVHYVVEDTTFCELTVA